MVQCQCLSVLPEALLIGRARRHLSHPFSYLLSASASAQESIAVTHPLHLGRFNQLLFHSYIDIHLAAPQPSTPSPTVIHNVFCLNSLPVPRNVVAPLVALSRESAPRTGSSLPGTSHKLWSSDRVVLRFDVPGQHHIFDTSFLPSLLSFLIPVLADHSSNVGLARHLHKHGFSTAASLCCCTSGREGHEESRNCKGNQPTQLPSSSPPYNFLGLGLPLLSMLTSTFPPSAGCSKSSRLSSLCKLQGPEWLARSNPIDHRARVHRTVEEKKTFS